MTTTAIPGLVSVVTTTASLDLVSVVTTTAILNLVSVLASVDQQSQAGSNEEHADPAVR